MKTFPSTQSVRRDRGRERECFFTESDTNNITQLWTSDGTPQGTTQLTALSDADSYLTSLVYVPAAQGAHGRDVLLRGQIVSRVKILSHLNIAEKRLPQDGRIKIRVDESEVDIRVSVIPMLHGEAVVMRLLRQNATLRGMGELDMNKRELEGFRRVLQLPHGIILVTGPTGSGKTSTLYTALNEINDALRKIITIEDPVEYQLKGVNQIQVSEKAGLTFARGLRSILRHDPDVILIGEIRDQETAQIAVQASLTGHLVFSTLHTNDAPGALTRLVDMGVEPYLVASSLEAVLAQRLVRVLCQHCKQEDHSPTAQAFKASLGIPRAPRFIARLAAGNAVTRDFTVGTQFSNGWMPTARSAN